MKSIELLDGRILVEVTPRESETSSGIIIPDTWEGGRRLEGARNTGTILNIGDGEDSALKARTKDHLQVGQKIIWKKHLQSYMFDEDKKTYAIIKFEHVEAVLE